MKKRNRIIALCLAGMFGFTQTACMGSFNLTTGLYDWNQDATSNRFVNNLLFWVMLVVPVYEFAFLADFVVLNLIEFWSGSNPTAMEAGEVEKQIYEKNGIAYEMKATKNNFEITVLNGENAGDKVHLRYNPANKSWNKVEEDGTAMKLVQLNEAENEVTIFQKDGKSITLDNNMDSYMALKTQKTWQNTVFYASAEQ